MRWCRIELILAVTLALAVAWRLGSEYRTRPLDNALVDAVVQGDAAAVEALLRRGADVNARCDASALWSVSRGKGTPLALWILRCEDR